MKRAEDRAAPCRAESESDSLSALRYLEQFEHLILTLSGRFVNLTSRDLDREIDHALRTIGILADVERSYVFQFSADRRHFTNTHEWCAPGVEPMIDRLQDAPAEKYAWALQYLLNGEELYVEDVEALPQEAAEVKQELRTQGIRSMVNVPLACAGRVIGFVGFDALRRRKSWTAQHRNLLKIVGEIIAGAIERERATATLVHRVELERLVADISTRFISVPVDRLEDEIAVSIRKIGEFTGVDRSYVFRLSEEGRTMDNTQEWCAEGIEPHIDRLQGQPLEPFGYSMQRLRRGEVFHVPQVSALPSDAAAEKSEFEREGIQCLVNVPIMARNTMIGFLGFDAVKTQKRWSEDDIRLLKLVGEIFANALERKTAEEKLQASVREKELLLREIHHRVKNNMQIVNSLLYLQEHAVRDRVGAAARDAFAQSRSRIKAMATIHDRLYRSKDFSRVNFADYLDALIPELLRSSLLGDVVDVEVQVDGIELGIDAAIPCGLIINELFTNSLKHAFPHGDRGKIAITMRKIANGRIELTVADDGIGFPDEASFRAQASLGLRLVDDLARQLDGEVHLLEGSGTRVGVRFSRCE